MATKPPFLPLTLLEGVHMTMSVSALAWSLPFLSFLPKGDGHQVLLLPGFMGDRSSLAVLSIFLSNILGYEVLPWTYGQLLKPNKELLLEIASDMEVANAMNNTKITLIGQSLGGNVARALACEYPKLVRHVITLGTPLDQDGISTSVTCLVEKILSTSEMKHLFIREETLPVPCTAIYSRLDGVVGHRAALQEVSDQAKNNEVFCGHAAMALSPSVFLKLANLLRQAH